MCVCVYVHTCVHCKDLYVCSFAAIYRIAGKFLRGANFRVFRESGPIHEKFFFPAKIYVLVKSNT